MKATGIVRRIDDLGRVVVPRRFGVPYGSGKGTRWKFLPTGRARSS